ncbi:hypothetical protein [Streptomyces sp. 6-11-2]|uniref:hypothetical protein n=1 Tax=Streptomyces sp. 6-11-2 TaxID=2585753 RepID=UPI0011437D47|nr:hypothetical protein [Streptomyces sp. 6-11-2]GED86308.1 hypothetical protein TNCT6_33930 [Streptomyces sp. 6-11-2]
MQNFSLQCTAHAYDAACDRRGTQHVDPATYDDSRQFADGVDHVVNGGAFALRDGHLRNATAGRAIRRGGSS